MTLRHISPKSSDWVDAMDEGGSGWDKLAPEELEKLRVEAQSSELASASATMTEGYGWGTGSASR